MAIDLFKTVAICLIIISVFSCKSKKCDCDIYKNNLSRVTVSKKSLTEKDVEVYRIGNFCCSRQIGSDDWTCILKNDAEIIINYTVNDSEENHNIYNLGFIGLSIDMFNIKNISYLKNVESIVDSLNNNNENRINSIYFDQYPNSIYIEMVDKNGFLIDNGMQLQIQN